MPKPAYYNNDRSINVSVTMPETLFGQIDRFCSKNLESRSIFFRKAATERLENENKKDKILMDIKANEESLQNAILGFFDKS